MARALIGGILKKELVGPEDILAADILPQALETAHPLYWQDALRLPFRTMYLNLFEAVHANPSDPKHTLYLYQHAIT